MLFGPLKATETAPSLIILEETVGSKVCEVELAAWSGWKNNASAMEMIWILQKRFKLYWSTVDFCEPQARVAPSQESELRSLLDGRCFLLRRPSHLRAALTYCIDLKSPPPDCFSPETGITFGRGRRRAINYAEERQQDSRQQLRPGGEISPVLRHGLHHRLRTFPESNDPSPSCSTNAPTSSAASP